jgi:hypothetical protein
MREPIEVNYEPEGEDWQVTVTGRGQTLRGTAPGLIAARDRADQLVEKLVPGEENRRVVHLLNGDALAFTSAYLSARLAKPTELPGEETPEAGKPDEEPPKVPSPAPSSEQAQRAATS